MKKIIVLALGFVFASSSLAFALDKPTYTVGPTSKTYKSKMMNFTTYNKYTKHYYLIRSYMERLEATGGGTLILKKGTYNIPNAIFIPSNVTLKLQDGVRIQKATKTGTSKFKASMSIFQLIRPSKAMKVGVYSGYQGDKNISIIGEGKAVIDMNFNKYAIGIAAGHNKNILIENISFQDNNSGHFIEMDATSDAIIRNNTFTGSIASSDKNKEAINLDTPDKETKGWNNPWSTYDKTPNNNITIENNSFYNLDRAIGTHKYSDNKYHNNIRVINNVIDTIRNDAIRVMNWSNSTIEGNKISNVGDDTKYDNRGILASGAINPTFTNNIFDNVDRVIQFIPWKNTGDGSKYPTTYNELSQDNKDVLKANEASNISESFIRINSEYGVYDSGTEKIWLN